MATIKTIERWLKGDGIKGEYFRPYVTEYYKAKNITLNTKLEEGNDKKERDTLPFITKAIYKSFMRMVRKFENYFDEEEFSKLVCKKLASYSFIHAVYLSTETKHPEIDVRRFATPCQELPPFMEVSVGKTGVVKISTDPARNPEPIAFF